MQAVHFPLRGPALTVALLAVLTGCTQPDGSFDWDLRSPGAGNTAEAARQATLPRPRADDRGVISYPGYQVVVARRGETVATIAARLGIGAADLGRANAIHPDMPLVGGEALVLPARIGEAPRGVGGLIGGTGGNVDVGTIATTALDRVATPAAPTAPAAGKEPIRHRVQRGETAYIVARRYNVSARALAEWNGLGADMALREGQTLLIPPADDSRPPAVIPNTSTTAPGRGSATPEPPSAAKPLPNETPARAGSGNSNAPASPSLPTSSNARMGMPADGAITRPYSKGKHDGIGISAPAGSPVRAAAAGTVAVISQGTDRVAVVGIQHEGNLLTLYANIDGITVREGAKVTRGQQIGTMRAGNPTYLRFEVRRGVESVDPMTMLQ